MVAEINSVRKLRLSRTAFISLPNEIKAAAGDQQTRIEKQIEKQLGQKMLKQHPELPKEDQENTGLPSLATPPQS